MYSLDTNGKLSSAKVGPLVFTPVNSGVSDKLAAFKGKLQGILQVLSETMDSRRKTLTK
jgi:hypothetical protein